MAEKTTKKLKVDMMVYNLKNYKTRIWTKHLSLCLHYSCSDRNFFHQFDK